MILKVTSFLSEDGSVKGTSLLFDSPKQLEQATDEQLVQMISEQGINATRIIKSDENVIGVKFGDDTTR